METLRTLPGDDVRQIMWRFAERFDLQMAVQSARSIARTTAARLVADGARSEHEWTPEKAQLLDAFDASGLTAIFMDPAQGGFVEGPKNLALALVGFELSWVDAGAATLSLASNLALSPIHERGTQEQKDYYMSRCVPAQPGEDRKTWRGAFVLTEPIPYVGVDTGVLTGKIRVAEWNEGEEPMLQVDKRGRFITNVAFADFATAAVDTDDERIKTSCMIILEKGDPGTFDPGAPTLKMCHQLSATNDPIFNLKVPASRIIGGYTIQDGVIVPNYSHGDVIAAVFNHTRITVGLMTSAKLLSAIEPIIRYHRNRFRGGDAAQPGSPRYEQGLQQKEDAAMRLIDVWAMGEAGASMGFATARVFDRLDPLEKAKNAIMAEKGITSGRKQLVELRKAQKSAQEVLELESAPAKERDQARLDELMADDLVRYALVQAEADVLCPATKLWNTGQGANMMREAVALMGGYGITEDCPGFLMHKWADCQLEATYEGPECVQRRQLSATMGNPVFLAKMAQWIKDLRAMSHELPGVGCGVLATAMDLWLWTYNHLAGAKDPEGKKLLSGTRQGVTFPLADSLCWLLAPRLLLMDALELAAKGPENPVLAEGLDGLTRFYFDLFHVQAARGAGEAARILAELVFGYKSVPVAVNSLDAECADVDRFEGLDEFVRLRIQLDGFMTGSRLAKERAAKAVTQVMIPEALDYPI